MPLGRTIFSSVHLVEYHALLDFVKTLRIHLVASRAKDFVDEVKGMA